MRRPPPRRPPGLALARLRLRRRAVSRWAAVGAVAVTAAWLVLGVVDRADRATAQWGEQVDALVATRTLQPGDRVSGNAVERRPWPRSLLPDGALHALDGGRVVAVRIEAGEPVSEHRLGPEGLSGVAALLPPGTRALGVPTLASDLDVRVGDLVDVLVVRGAPQADAVTVAEAAMVVGVDGGSVAIAVDVDLVGEVAGALATGTVTLALTTPGS